MPLTIKVIPGYQFFEGERLDTNKLNQLGRPTLDLLGSISTAIIAPGSVTSDKLASNLISTLPPKPNPLDGNDLLMIEDVTVTALKKITISQILTAGIRDLPTIFDVKIGDFAVIIQGDDTKKATVENFLREAISKQTTSLNSAGAIDPAADLLLVWDANGAAGSNQNRRARVGDVVASFTNTLIAHSNPFPAGGTLDLANDEILMNDASLTAPDQQVRVKLGTVVAQAGGIKAWANINAAQDIDEVSITVWDDSGSVIGAAPAGIQTGDWIWFRASDSGSGVLPWIPYYTRLLDGSTTQFRLFHTKAGALANTTADLVVLTQGTIGRHFLHWHSNPFRAGFNFTSIITTTQPSQRQGYFRIFFETPMLSANYAVQLTGSRYQNDDNANTGPICSINVGGANSDPSSVTASPSVNSFDLLCRSNTNGDATPDFLMIAVFS